MSSYLPRGDDVAGLGAPCIGDEIMNAAGLPERLNSFLAVVLAPIDGFDDFRIIEDLDRLGEIDLAGSPIFLTLVFIPAEIHGIIIYLVCVHNFGN
jgi:hypothetical protein